MGHGQDGSGEGLPARREERQEKDRLKAEFGGRLRVLLNLTGLSSREFAQRYPAYKDSTVRKYVLGTNLPPWDFLRDLLTEVTRRTDDPAVPQRRAELFTAYRQVLVSIGADLRGSDQNSLLLRLLDGEETLHRLGEELTEVRARENQLRMELEEETRRTAQSTPTSADEDRKHQLEEESRALAEHGDALAERRRELIADLDLCRARLPVLEETGELATPSPAGGADPHSLTGIPALSAPPGLAPGDRQDDRRSRRAVVLAVGALATVLLAGGGAAVGVWVTGGSGDTAQQPPPAIPSSTASPTAAPGTPAESVTPDASTPAPGTPTETFLDDGSVSLVSELAPMEGGPAYQSGQQRVNTRDYPIALATSPDGYASATWQLDREYAEFTALVGAADSTSSSASLTMWVEVDGETKSQITVKAGGKPVSVRVDLHDAFRFTLSAETNDSASGQAVWINPAITK